MDLQFGITTSPLDVRLVIWDETELNVCGPFSEFKGAQRAAIQLLEDYTKKLTRARLRVEGETEGHLRWRHIQQQRWCEEINE